MDMVNNMTELCGRSAHRHVMLSIDELKLKYGNIVKKEHKVAGLPLLGRELSMLVLLLPSLPES